MDAQWRAKSAKVRMIIRSVCKTERIGLHRNNRHFTEAIIA